MQIFIPTRDRVEAQFTWENLTPELQQHTRIVCPEEEVSLHQAKGRNALARPPVKLAEVRQWLVETISNPDEPMFMLDDDLAFFGRITPEKYNLEPISSTPRLNILFQLMENLVTQQGYAHVGLSPRQGNNRHFPKTLLHHNRMNAVHCVLPRVLLQADARYDACDMMEDYHVTLTLLEKGIENAVVCDHAWDQVKGSGAPGGFSHYRTKERQAAAAERLAGLHPGYVRVVEKEPKTGQGENWGGVRTDVRVYWTKAFKGTPLTKPTAEVTKKVKPAKPTKSYRKDRETRKLTPEADNIVD